MRLVVVAEEHLLQTLESTAPAAVSNSLKNPKSYMLYNSTTGNAQQNRMNKNHKNANVKILHRIIFAEMFPIR